MTEPDPRTEDPKTPPPRRKVSRSTWVIVGMVAVWLVAILYRNEIRARWWAYRMASTESQIQRVGYFQRLASLGELAVPRARSLLDHHDASLRSFAVALLHPSSSDEATEGLIQAGRDRDEDVRRLAIQGLGLRDQERSTEALIALLNEGDQRSAMMAVDALSRHRDDEVTAVLLSAAKDHVYPGVRVEAIHALQDHAVTTAVLLLLEMLEDAATFEGVTERDGQARIAFEAVEDQLSQQGKLSSEAGINVPQRHRVGSCAEEALRGITGIPGPEEEIETIARDELVKRWLKWSQEHGRKPPKP